MSEIVRKITEIIKEFIEKKMFGSIEIKFENGKVVNLKRTESMKI